MSIKISACCIIKNEEANLPVWLANMAKVADEIIVVDTGSEVLPKRLVQRFIFMIGLMTLQQLRILLLTRHLVIGFFF